jgi:acetoacetate decarboxylase
MGFVKTMDEISANHRETGDFYDAEVLTVYFETKPEIIQAILPPPLTPGPLPIGAAFVANYPKTNFGLSYLESALFLMAVHNGEEGVYCLSMPVNNDMALILGRERFGYPKKIAHIYLEREGNDFRGGTERHGVRFLEMKARMEGAFNDHAAQQFLTEAGETNPDIVVYNFKYFPNPERTGFDYNPRLIKETVKQRPKRIEYGEAQLNFNPSPHDPWSEVEIVKVYGATFSVGDNSMLPGEVVAEVDPNEFFPYAFLGMDNL